MYNIKYVKRSEKISSEVTNVIVKNNHQKNKLLDHIINSTNYKLEDIKRMDIVALWSVLEFAKDRHEKRKK